MTYRIRLMTMLLAVAFAMPLAAQKRVAETEQEKLGAQQFNEAITAYSSGEYAKCIPLFIAADSLLGGTNLVDRGKLRFALGSAFAETGDMARALEYYKLVAAHDSSYPSIHLQVAETARAAGRKAEALTYFKAALQRATPDGRPAILARIGELALSAGRLQNALSALDEAIQIKPATGFHLLRGQVYDAIAQKIDHAEDEDFDYERAIRRKEITEEQINEANALREKALEDYRSAERDSALADACGQFIARSEVILENNKQVISEIRFQDENN